MNAKLRRNLLIWLALPLTIIVMGTVTKKWWVLPEDAPDVIMAGFPRPFVADGFHTSLSLQFFIRDLLIDFTVQLAAVYLLVYLLYSWQRWKSIHRFWKWMLWVPAALILLLFGTIASFRDNRIGWKRDWEMHVYETRILPVVMYYERTDEQRARMNRHWDSLLQHRLMRLQ